MTAMPSPLLSIQNVRRTFRQSRGFLRKPGRLHAVDDVSLCLFHGETLGLVGESGCGKSTLARLTVRLLRPDAGDVLLEGESVFSGPKAFQASLPRRLQMIFQDPYASLNPRMRIGASVGEALACSGMPRKQREAKVAALLEQVGLRAEHARSYPHEFSGGQRQRMAIARALAPEPSLIVCDEPVSALDASVQAQVLNLLKDSQDRLNLGYLFISHDLAVISHMSDRIAVMYRGKIVEQGTSPQLFTRPTHPYTHLLLETARQRRAGQEKNPIAPANLADGTLPLDDAAPWTGCAFYPRCHQRQAQCREDCPPLLPYKTDATPGPDTHCVRCFLA